MVPKLVLRTNLELGGTMRFLIGFLRVYFLLAAGGFFLTAVLAPQFLFDVPLVAIGVFTLSIIIAMFLTD